MKALYWQPRGIGSNGGWPSLVTGDFVPFGPDLSGFVVSKEDGKAVVEMFGGNAKLDFRDFEPDWIQVKVIVEEEHREVLQRLHDGVSILGGFLNPKVLAWALEPEAHPGYEPLALRVVREMKAKLEEAGIRD
jgi:hypothetical protein